MKQSIPSSTQHSSVVKMSSATFNASENSNKKSLDSDIVFKRSSDVDKRSLEQTAGPSTSYRIIQTSGKKPIYRGPVLQIRDGIVQGVSVNNMDLTVGSYGKSLSLCAKDSGNNVDEDND